MKIRRALQSIVGGDWGAFRTPYASDTLSSGKPQKKNDFYKRKYVKNTNSYT